MTSLMNTPPLIRNIAVVGQFHHGKTLFVDTLVMATHTEEWDPSKEIRYSDTRKDEQERELSIKSTPLSLVLESIRGKSYLLNVLDCPGHINFCDEVGVYYNSLSYVNLSILLPSVYDCYASSRRRGHLGGCGGRCYDVHRATHTTSSGG